MSRIWSMMDIGKRSMMNSQSALQTVSHNIANKSTEGYSRQRVELQTNEPVGFGKLRMGMGSKATTVSRINNEFIEKQVEREGSLLGMKDGRSQTLMRVEQVYNEQQNRGLNKYLGEFFNAFRELSNNPENSAIRSLVKETADFLTRDFKRVNDQLKKIQSEVDYQVGVQVTEVNEITKEIANLNEKIRMVEVNSQSANDERDRRELLIKSLSEKMNIRYGESSDGQFTITAGNSALLVSGSSYRELLAANTGERTDKGEGNVDVFYKPSEYAAPVNITRQLTGGQLGGMLEVRDKFINELRDSTDEMAYTFANEVNKAHMSGYDRYNVQGGAFFDLTGPVKGASERLKVSDHILEDAGRIVSGQDPNAPADNRVANVISSLQYQQVMGGGQSTFDDFYNNVVGKVGVSASRANSEFQAQKDIVGQLKNIRESISGVSLDEETAKMIEYQKMFDASARLIRTTDEMMETVLNLKPM
jgi:flagellar hook-associated protein 1